MQKLIIYSAGAINRNLRNRLDVQRILFLISRSKPEMFADVCFRRHEEGPYSEAVDEDLDILSNGGYIAESGFGLSDKGISAYRSIEKLIDPSLKDSVEFNKEFILLLSEDELLTFIYVLFPEYMEKSEVWDKLNNSRLESAVSMVKKEAVTVSVAAEVAGLNYSDFEDELISRKVRWKS